jgi:lipopolysaccharide/colanic/teichoic acid biosynthesis glycosyltransferase
MMKFGSKKATTLLYIGDATVFITTLWLTLLVRYFAVPSSQYFMAHVYAFVPVFCIWIVVFYMAGLYGKRAIFFKNELSGTILRTQLLNIVLAALFFFFVPGVGIAPKTTLLLYLGLSLAGIFIWRFYLFTRFTQPVVRDSAVLIGEGPEVQELMDEVNNNSRYQMEFLHSFTPAELQADFESCAKELLRLGVKMLVVDTEHDVLRPLLPRIYELAFVSPTYEFVDFYEMYEEVFDRVPLSLLQYDWFLKNVSRPGSNFYAVMKRAIDILGGVAMFVIMGITLPFVWLALRLEGSGPLFIVQDRLGVHGSPLRAYKFRSMRYSDSGTWKGEGENYVTRVGSFLRMTSLDEFPQCLNVLSGELSLIGPRNDILALANRLSAEIPYYRIRYIIKPGITGWAQINQQYEQGNISPQSVRETKTRLAYDFYYIKNRSLALDIVIALKTVKRMFFRLSPL